MLAFDPAQHPDIRNAATGLIVAVTLNFGDGESITIQDETKTNEVTITNTTGGSIAAASTIANMINKTVESAKIAGKVPDTFNVKAFQGSSATELIFISDKQFTLIDVDTTLTAAKTLAGSTTLITADGSKGLVPDVNATGATSVYGEYAMIIEPLVGPNTASELDFTVGTGALSKGPAAVVFGNINGDSAGDPILLTTNNLTATLGTAVTAITNDEVFNNTIEFTTGGDIQKGLITQIDTDNNTSADMLLVAANKPFYIKDNTFTRVYSVDTDADGLGDGLEPFFVVPFKNPSVTPLAATAAAVVAAVNTIADGTTSVDVDASGIYAAIDPNDAKKIIIVSNSENKLELNDVNSATLDYFSKASSSSDMAKGAVKRVINIAELAREKMITNKFVMTAFTDADAADINATAGININGLGVDTNTTITEATDTDTKRMTILTDLVNNANQLLKDNNISAFASYTIPDANYPDTIAISIEGIGITSAAIDTNASNFTITAGAEDHATAGEFNLDSAAIVTDLKANAVYTPDYVNNGPIYTLKSAGYEAKAIINASTDINATATTYWSHIDMSRDSKEWFKDNEYSLFNINNHAGYWVYIEDYSAQDDIVESNVIWTPSYAYHFNTKTGATDNLVNSATFSVEINDGSAEGGVLDEETSNAKLVISGQEIQLTKTGTTFGAVLTGPEVVGMTPNSGPIAVTLHATDGMGESYTSELFTFDYDKPAKPTVSFVDGANIALSDTSADVASYYMWKNYIPDNGTSNTPLEENLSPENASVYNICKDTSFGTENTYHAIAFDGTGVMNKANASDITSFIYRNAIKGATVLTHTNGESTKQAVNYDANCEVKETSSDAGVNIISTEAGTIVVSFEGLEGALDPTTDLPYSAYYAIDGGNDILQIIAPKAYASKVFYVEYNNALYTGAFPTSAQDDTLAANGLVEITTATNISLD
jgi:hypothetical protein